MSEKNQNSTTEHYVPPSPESHSRHDEIDLREVVKALWNGKLTISIITFVFFLVALFYSLNAQEWWSSQAKVGQAQEQDLAAYRQQVKQYQPIFDIYQDDGSVLVNEELDDLIDPKVLFKRFMGAFNSSNNKRVFLDSSDEFKKFKEKLNEDLAPEELEIARRALYSGWFTKISASAERVVKETEKNAVPYDIAFQSTSRESSFLLLKQYIDVIKHKAHQDALNNLDAIVSSKKNELSQQKQILMNQAKHRLMDEVDKAEYALGIAEAASITEPIQLNSRKELFDISFGAKALAAKIQALKSVKNLNVIEPRIQEINAKLMMLESLKINRKIEFQTFRFIENIEPPITRDRPKRALIVVLGTLLGVMLSFAIVLMLYAFRKEKCK
ncbi:Wzz/FepE/Etk N-terminal domain-containing protein [Vibrio ostreicida]|uniref:Wzz/FepE/Etk N-terminal domain-containing protein n=1 Tax=Vibrio ostreicida TaxID=526588 RepID=A0ABT8BX17_9VIBR|nr:Wzz/FepE/Etk N-terminal domain-containing protein [Vibrio ostreicida]MDN3611229.1 Wzz/FepE/Etk N-terminal domain-containing protein [Vibrio ostreicida]